MNTLKRPQKEKAKQFCVFTGARCIPMHKDGAHLSSSHTQSPPCRSEKVAVELLTVFGWSLEAAVDAFFTGAGSLGSSAGPAIDSAKVAEMFAKYKEADVDEIQVAGTERFCTDLGVDPSDPIMLIICWQMRCKHMCVFTLEEWTQGFTAMGVESVDALSKSFAKLRALLDDPENFRDFYSWCFDFSKEPGHGVRSLAIEVARQMWQMTIGARYPEPVARWIEFVEVRRASRGPCCAPGSRSAARARASPHPRRP